MPRTVHTSVRFLLAGALAVALAPVVSAFAAVIVPVGANPGPLAVIPQTGELVVVNSGSDDVSIVDRGTLHVSTVHAGSLPAAIAVNRATGYAYVANSWGNTVTAIYGYGEGKKRKTYAVGVGPINLAVNAATNTVYVVNNEDGTVSAIDENTGTTTTIPVGSRPRGIAVNEATNRIYVGNIWDATVTVIDGSTNSPLATVPVVVWPYDVAVNPLTNRIYVGSGDGFGVTVIDGATYNTRDISGGIWQPAFLAVNTVTNKIYAAGAQGGGGVMVIDGATDTAIELATPLGPWGFASLAAIKVNEVTNRIYVVDAASKDLLVIDGIMNELTVRPLDFEPCSAAVDPAINRVYVSHCSDSRISIVNE
jgi:YVTN family beta-propeller protein